MDKFLKLRFAEDNNFSDKAIKLFSRGEYTHVDIIYDNQLIGARLKGGVAIRDWNYKQFYKTKIVSIPVDQDQYKKAITFLFSQIGKPYDWKAIASFAFNRNWRKHDSWFCSELAAVVCEKAGIFKRLYREYDKVTPVDLLFALSVITEV